jgi:hypothetical protein
MKNGKMYAMTGATPMAVKTAQGIVMLPSDSSALIEEKAKGVLRVQFLTGDAGGAVDVAVKGEHKQLTADAGQEILIAGAGVDDEELIPIDGVERVAVSASMKVGSLTVQKNRYDRKALVERTALLNCNTNCFPTYIRAKLNKMKAQASSPKKLSVAPSAGDPHFMPIAQFQSATTAAAQRMSTFEFANATIKHMDIAKFNVLPDNRVRMNSGEVVVSAHKETVVSTKQTDITVAPGVIAVIWSDGKTTKVRSLWEGKTNGVDMVSNGRAVSASAGQEVIVCEDDSTLQRLLQADSNARRRVHTTDLPGGRVVMSSEISFVSLITQSPVLMQIFSSKAESDEAIGAKLKKMAVCLSIVTGRQSDRAPHSSPRCAHP